MMRKCWFSILLEDTLAKYWTFVAFTVDFGGDAISANIIRKLWKLTLNLKRNKLKFLLSVIGELTQYFIN